MTEIEPARLAALLKAENTLRMLRFGGVDNWDWYGDSLNPDEGKSASEYDDEVDAALAGTLTPNT